MVQRKRKKKQLGNWKLNVGEEGKKLVRVLENGAYGRNWGGVA